jgi:hypothetical protein
MRVWEFVRVIRVTKFNLFVFFGIYFYVIMDYLVTVTVLLLIERTGALLFCHSPSVLKQTVA